MLWGPERVLLHMVTRKVVVSSDLLFRLLRYNNGVRVGGEADED